MSSVLHVEALAKHYGGTPVFANVQFTVQPGEFVAIVGDSGVGKSTLLNCLAGLDHWDAGRIVHGDTDLAPLDEAQRALWRRAHVGFVFQAFHVLPHLSVAQNVALPLMLLGRTEPDRVQQMLAAVGLADLGERLPQQLSGGQLQRVAIARALVHRPGLLLADEPTGNLDTHTSDDIMTSFGTLNRERGITIVLVTHEPDVAAYSRRLVRLKDGRVLYDGPAAEGLQLASSQAGAAR